MFVILLQVKISYKFQLFGGFRYRSPYLKDIFPSSAKVFAPQKLLPTKLNGIGPPPTLVQVQLTILIKLKRPLSSKPSNLDAISENFAVFNGVPLGMSKYPNTVRSKIANLFDCLKTITECPDFPKVAGYIPSIPISPSCKESSILVISFISMRNFPPNAIKLRINSFSFNRIFDWSAYIFWCRKKT